MATLKPHTRKYAFLLIDVVNLSALLTLGSILLLTSINMVYQFVILLPILALIILYCICHNNKNIIAYFCSLSLLMLLWVVICENVVYIDNLLGTRITTQLRLSWRLEHFIDTAQRRASIFQQCCNDALSYNRKAGWIARSSYDCALCNPQYEVMVDDTGYLNGKSSSLQSNGQINLFLAGDSVTQGIGGPSVLEYVNEHIPIRMWNLSTEGYGPRQKINALITYALPKRPKWIIVEFYSGNDVSDAIEDEICEGLNDYRCRFSVPEMRWRSLTHPVYKMLLDTSPYIFELFNYLSANNLTLAVTRYTVDSIKNTVKKRLTARSTQDLPLTEFSRRKYNFTDVSHPAHSNLSIRDEKLMDWVRAGIGVTHKHYERLVAILAGIEYKPTIILLYNPSAYEIYRDLLLDRNPAYDKISAFQREAQKSFAERQGWTFIDLTTPLRNKLQEDTMWIYGRYDGTHWSPQGTVWVAAVLTTELAKVIGNVDGSM
jgi:hypothetical protein